MNEAVAEVKVPEGDGDERRDSGRCRAGGTPEPTDEDTRIADAAQPRPSPGPGPARPRRVCAPACGRRSAGAPSVRRRSCRGRRATAAIRRCWATQLDRLLLDRGWKVDVAVGSVMGRWTEIVGPDIAGHVEPLTFVDGVLTVRADSTAWATQMRLLASSMLARIDEEIGAGAVSELKVVGPSAPSWNRGAAALSRLARPPGHLRLSGCGRRVSVIGRTPVSHDLDAALHDRPALHPRGAGRQRRAAVATHAREALRQDELLRASRRTPTSRPTRRTAPRRPRRREPAAPAPRPADLRRQGHADHAGNEGAGRGGAPSRDDAVNEAYDGLGATWELWSTAYARDSLDGKGMPLLASVHYGRNYDNAFWDGTQMVFGDGDGVIFSRFTKSRRRHRARADPRRDRSTRPACTTRASRARSTSRSRTSSASSSSSRRSARAAAQADWLIGADLLAPGVKGRALRDMRNPGTAYDDPRLGKDPQPASMADYVHTERRQRRRPHQLRHPQPRLRARGLGDRRQRVGDAPARSGMPCSR